MHDYTLVVIAAFAHSAMENDGHAMMRERIAHMERVGMSSDEPNGQHTGTVQCRFGRQRCTAAWANETGMCVQRWLVPPYSLALKRWGPSTYSTTNVVCATPKSVTTATTWALPVLPAGTVKTWR